MCPKNCTYNIPVIGCTFIDGCVFWTETENEIKTYDIWSIGNTESE